MSIENSFVGPKPTFEKDGITEVNVEAHINEARNYALTHNPLDILQWFKGKVSNKGDWDYKQQDRKYADFGNWHYGLVAKAIGIPESMALSGAGGAQISSIIGEKYGSFYGFMALDYAYGLLSFLGGAYVYPNNGFGLLDDPKDVAQILSGFKSYDDNYGDMTNPIFDSFINKATSYANKFFAQSSARNLGHIPMILINHDICSLCGVCVSACQKEILETKGGIIQINFKNMEENGTCDGCVACMGFCPQEAIEIY